MTWHALASRNGLLAFVLLGVTGIAALSVHVVLQQVLGVPFPQVASVPAYAKLLRPVSGTLALMVFSRWSARHACCRGVGMHVFWVFVASAAMLQTLRGAVMSGVVTTAVAFHVVSGVASLLETAWLAVVVVLVTRCVRTWWRLGVLAFVIAVPTSLIVDPFIASGIDRWIGSLSSLRDHAEVYAMPYGPRILLWAYVTYIEPVAGALLAASLIIPALEARTRVYRTICFAILSAGLAAQFVPPILWTWFMPRPAGVAFISTFQFTLEYVVLGAGAMIATQVLMRGSPSGGACPRK